MYLGILLGMFGTAVVIGQLRGMLAATAVLFALLWKIKAEEKILSNHFGERFQQYKKNAKSIIPFIY
jgi:protein-S-isoprenylcysteine O-methyltransferase Ste14